MTTLPDFTEPVVEEGIGQYRYTWQAHGVTVKVSRLDDEAVGEVAVTHRNGDNKTRLLSISRLNLLAKRSCSELAKDLSQNMSLDWNTMLTYIAFQTISRLRRGEPVCEIGNKPPTMKREYLLHPILPLNQPTTIYAPGGSVKSALALYIACLVQYHLASPLGWVGQPGNVLYLDWEDDRSTHERRLWAIKQGLDIPEDMRIKYRSCSRPLVEQIDDIATVVNDFAISLIIIDSAMAAMTTGKRYSSDPSDPASQYYNALRSFKCTSLTIDHVAKHRNEMGDANNTGPYGSVVKTNRARNQFEVKHEQQKGSPIAYLNIVHTKVNEGMRLKDTGIEVHYINDSEGNAERIDFMPCNPEDIPKFAQAMSLRDRAINVLKRGTLSARRLGEEMGLEKSEIPSLYAMLNRYKGKHGGFVKLHNEEWGLYADEGTYQ